MFKIPQKEDVHWFIAEDEQWGSIILKNIGFI